MLGLWIAGAIGGFDRPNPVIGWACVAFFGFAAVAGGLRMRQSGPALRVDERGIWRTRLRGEPVTYPWEAIDAIEVRPMRRQRFVCLWLTEKRDPLRTALGRGPAFGDVALTTAGTDGDMDAFIDAVARFRRR